MTVILKNTTDIPDQKIWEIIKFTQPVDVRSDFSVRVTNSNKNMFCGKFYRSVHTRTKIEALKVIVRVTKDENKFPFYSDNTPQRPVRLYFERLGKRTGKYQTWYATRYIPDLKKRKNTGGYINCLLLSREEAVILVMAHELRHLWQMDHRRKRRIKRELGEGVEWAAAVWGSRGQYSNRDADAYAIRKVREWRKKHNIPLYCPVYQIDAKELRLLSRKSHC